MIHLAYSPRVYFLKVHKGVCELVFWQEQLITCLGLLFVAVSSKACLLSIAGQWRRVYAVGRDRLSFGAVALARGQPVRY